MSKKIIYNFIKDLKCNVCNSTKKISSLNISNNRIIKGSLKCKNCSSITSIKNGVINYDKNKNSINSNYKRYWEFSPSNFSYKKNLGEEKIFKKFSNYFKKNNILDAGCGNGRLIRTLILFKPKLIVATDLSESIFIAAKNYKNKFNKIPIIFIYQNIENKFIKEKYFDVVISLGTINFNINQKKIIKNLNKMKKKLIILGLVSKQTTYGKIYSNLNLLRLLTNFKILQRIIFFLFNLLNFKTNSKNFINFRNFLYSILEVIFSPKIIRKDNTYYYSFFKKIIYFDKSKLIDYIFAK